MSSIVELLLDTSKSDTDLLRKNDSLGDVLYIPREVDFLLWAPDEKKARLVADFTNDNCYGTATALSDENGNRVQVIIEMPITLNLICAVSGLMACISKVFDVEYDGWGSVIKKQIT